MSVFHAAAGSVVVVSGLLLASVLLAAQGSAGMPFAQMNRSSYDSIYIPRYVPRHKARTVTAGMHGFSQINRTTLLTSR